MLLSDSLGGKMNLTLKQEDLERALQIASSVVPSKSTMQILETVLIEAEGEEAVFTATDLDVSVRTRCPVEVEAPGKAAVSARRLYEVVRELPDEQVSLTGDEQKLTLARSAGQYGFVGAAVEDFPPLPKMEDESEIGLPHDKLVRLIKRTLYAVSSDETRPELTGVLLEVEPGEARMVATNGHRLARATVSGKFSGKWNVLIPGKSLNQFLRLASSFTGDVRIAATKSYARFTLGETQMYTRLLEGPFPDYRRVIPADNPLKAVVNREAIQSSLKRILVLSDSQTRQVRLEFQPERLTIMAEYQGAGEAKEEIPIEYEAEPLLVGFNGGYLFEMLRTFDSDRLEMAFESPRAAGLFRPIGGAEEEDLLCLIMPLRLPEAGGGDEEA